MPELLIELFCEEIPARMQSRAAEDFARLMSEACAAEGLVLENPIAHHGPRRITLVAEAPTATDAVREERRGPRVDAPARAIDGFLSANGVGLDVLERRDTGKGVYWFLNVERPGRAAIDVIGAALPAVLKKLPWPKSMRWGGAGDFTFARPLRRILCLFDGAVVPLPEPVAGLTATNITEGHRFLATAPFAVDSFAHYVRRLREACVVVDAAERRRFILEGARTAAQEAGLVLVEDEGLLDEVTGLVEWPCPLLGRIDSAFMDLPPEVLRTSMRVNQRYFATTHPDGTPAPHFVVIANVPGTDGGAAIVAGNERVLRARFSDARFFWEQDRKQPLEAFLPKLESVVFHAKLGTQFQRVERLQSLVGALFNSIHPDPAKATEEGMQDQAVAAARLAKADLATGMVAEFPDLQGLIGSYYLTAQVERDVVPNGEGIWDPDQMKPADWADVAAAIRDHYAPRGPSEPVPTAYVTIMLSMADKLDQIVQFFSIGEKPTGSGDPFALRRAALGVVRIILENRLNVDLRELVVAVPRIHASPSLTDDVLVFFRDRFVHHLRVEGGRYDIVMALLARNPDMNLYRVLSRAAVFEDVLGTPDGNSLLTAYRRVAGILKRAEQTEVRRFDGKLTDVELLPAELHLVTELMMAYETLQPDLEGEQFKGAVLYLARRLRPLVDAFFKEVLVNAPDENVRHNRLNILAQARSRFDQFADFSQIKG
jgi:glycyl-tRNA synthetase beta chain